MGLCQLDLWIARYPCRVSMTSQYILLSKMHASLHVRYMYNMYPLVRDVHVCMPGHGKHATHARRWGRWGCTYSSPSITIVLHSSSMTCSSRGGIPSAPVAGYEMPVLLPLINNVIKTGTQDMLRGGGGGGFTLATDLVLAATTR